MKRYIKFVLFFLIFGCLLGNNVVLNAQITLAKDITAGCPLNSKGIELHKTELDCNGYQVRTNGDKDGCPCTIVGTIDPCSNTAGRTFIFPILMTEKGVYAARYKEEGATKALIGDCRSFPAKKVKKVTKPKISNYLNEMYSTLKQMEGLPKASNKYKTLQNKLKRLQVKKQLLKW